MQATKFTCPKGPALLAKAGVALSDALAFYRQQRLGNRCAREVQIRRKVHRFLARNNTPARAHVALA